MPRIEIIAGGIYGATGEVPVGSVHDVATVPDGWSSKVRVLADEAPMEIALTGITTEAIVAGADIGAVLDALDREANPDRDHVIAEIEALGGKVDRRKSTDTLAAELAGLKG